MTNESVLLRCWQSGASCCFIIVGILNRNKYYSVENFLKKVLD